MTNVRDAPYKQGGAEFLDPMMRNSREFPKWLNAPETKEKLKGKKVMMYCTVGWDRYAMTSIDPCEFFERRPGFKQLNA